MKSIRSGRGGYACVELHDIRVNVDGKKISKKVHILVMEAFIGVRSNGYHIDHINGNKMDARLCNLEYVTPRENYARGRAGDQRPNKSCNLRGVRKCKKSGKYIAGKAWGRNGKTERYHLGTYETPEEAHEAYMNTTYEQAKAMKEERANDPLRAFGRINWKLENKGKLLGVKECKRSGKFLARKMWRSEQFHLGTYETPEEAHEAYMNTTYEQAVAIKEARRKPNR